MTGAAGGVNRWRGRPINGDRNQMHSAGTAAAAIRPATMAEMTDYWRSDRQGLRWTCPFVQPPWLDAWWTAFADGFRWNALSVALGDRLAGIAPLMRRGSEVRLIGDAEVCDHLDVGLAPGHADAFTVNLLDHLAGDGVRRLDLSPVREDAAAVTHLLPAARRWGAKVHCEHGQRLFVVDLPAGWEAYLHRLSGKERHEIRRKLRRLDEAGPAVLRCLTDPADVPAAMDRFLTLFRANRADKAAFMTREMTVFFRHLAANLAAAGLLKLYLLDLDGRTVAAVMCIDDGETVYLYNNGYDAAYRSLGVGVMSKVLTIKAAIRDGRSAYDFLKGDEPYKQRLGGRPVALMNCRVEWG